MSDARIASTLRHHPKIRRLHRALGDSGVLALIYLWAWAAEHRPRGVLNGLDPLDIADVAGFAGDPVAFVDALVQVRLVDDTNGVLSLHDWPEHNPYAYHAPERRERAKLGAAARWGSNATSMPRASSKHRVRRATSNAPSPAPSPSPSPAPSPSPSPAPKSEEKSIDVPPATPSALHSDVASVATILNRVRVNARGITIKGDTTQRLQTIIEQFPEQDVVASANDWEDWATNRRRASQPIRDAVGSMRNFVKRDAEDGTNKRKVTKPSAPTSSAPVKFDKPGVPMPPEARDALKKIGITLATSVPSETRDTRGASGFTRVGDVLNASK